MINEITNTNKIQYSSISFMWWIDQVYNQQPWILVTWFWYIYSTCNLINWSNRRGMYDQIEKMISPWWYSFHVNCGTRERNRSIPIGMTIGIPITVWVSSCSGLLYSTVSTVCTTTVYNTVTGWQVLYCTSLSYNRVWLCLCTVYN